MIAIPAIKMMLLSRICLIEFGAFLLAAMALLARQVGLEWRRRGMTRLKAEDAVLLAGAVATCGVYAVGLVRAHGAAMPGVSGGWVEVFGASCAVHVAMKAIRALTKT